jgi:hypothetical protein
MSTCTKDGGHCGVGGYCADCPAGTAADTPQTLTELHWHEALHTAHIVEELFDTHLWGHPAIQQTPAVREQARAISIALSELYQAIGAAHPAMQPTTWTEPMLDQVEREAEQMASKIIPPRMAGGDPA